MTIKILHEDNKILVIEKPIGIPVQADSSGDADLLASLKQYLKEKYNKPGNVYLGLVHRLDRPVGGVMVFARNSKSAANLSEQIRNHEFKKIYLAIVNGRLRETGGQLRGFLLKDAKANIVKVVSKDTPGSKEAILDYEVLDENDGLSLVKINLKTGRPHQVRVQFANIGNPLYGDRKYGQYSKQNVILREPQYDTRAVEIALWSHEVQFVHPGTKENVEFKLNPPKTYPWNLFNL